MSNADRPTTGVILPDVLYSLDTFAKVTGYGRRALTEMRQRGLAVRKCGQRAWILGADFLAFLNHTTESPTADTAID